MYCIPELDRRYIIFSFLDGPKYRVNFDVKAIPLLTVNVDKLILQKQVEELAEKSKGNEYTIKAKLQEKDDALVILSDQVMKLMTEVQQLKKLQL